MRYLVLVCILLVLGDCSSAGSYGVLGSYAASPVTDLGACSVSPIETGHYDKFCNRQNASIY
jgi:hypothetical protein